MKKTYSCTIIPEPVEPIIVTSKSIYTKSEDRLLKEIDEIGYEVVRLGISKRGESWYSEMGHVVEASCDYKEVVGNVRFIVKKKEPKQLKDLMVNSNVGKVFEVEQYLNKNKLAHETIRLVRVRNGIIHAVDAVSGEWYTDVDGLKGCDVRLVKEVS